MNSKATKIISFQTVGCRLNQYETEKMAADLAPFGFERANRGQPADLYIINSCTVTHRADKDSRYLVRRAKRENPDSRVVLVGCYVETDPEGIADLEGVDLVILNSEKNRLAQILPQKLPTLFEGGAGMVYAPVLADFYQRNRAWIKVSDGCNQTCSFCLVTIVRGELTCRPASEIISEINQLVAHGYDEVVLTGVNIGYYSDREIDPPIKNFTELCGRILDSTELYRLRLSSTEPQTVTDELLELCAQNLTRICRHFHIPMQSGSSRILKQMRRPYDRERFLNRVKAIRQAVPNVVIGADVIVGFPGESESEFVESRTAAESGMIDYLHVFSYSDRPKTAAAEMPNKIRPQIIKERNAELTRVSNRLRYESHRRQIGQTLEVISEYKSSADACFGISDNYIRVKLPAEVAGGRNIVKVKITSAHHDHVAGNILL